MEKVSTEKWVYYLHKERGAQDNEEAEMNCWNFSSHALKDACIVKKLQYRR